MPRHLLSIGRKFGLLYAALVVLLIVVCTLVILNVRAMRRDAAKLLEETREAGVASRLNEELTGLFRVVGLQRELRAGAPGMLRHAEERIAGARLLLDRLEAGVEHDPSRPEHQAEEARIEDRIRDLLTTIEEGVRRNAGGPEEDRVLETARRAHRYSVVLAEETRKETGLANEDLVEIAEDSNRIIVATVAACVIALCMALVLAFRTIVKPIRILREGTDRFGAGILDQRITVRNRDEIGDLARSFNRMAESIGRSHIALEEQVQERTRQYLRAARLADLGLLAAGLAHEINNPLASIASCAEGLERRLRSGKVLPEEQADYLRTIASEAWRAREITTRLLALARNDAGPISDVDLVEVCKQVELMVRHQMEKSGVRLVMELPQRMESLRGSVGDLIQMIVNLLLNARDASPEDGTVWLRAAAEDGAVVLEVEDQGPGVPEQDVERVFDPFVTSKEPGRGTGLGLSLVATIAECHRGRIDVCRGTAGGALFRVRLEGAAEPVA